MTIPVALLLLGVPTEHVGFIAAGHTPLTITSDSTPDVNTGDTAVVTVTTSGSFGDIDFAIIGGTDAGAFTINDETGALAFRTASVDGTYEVIVRAFSDWGSATQTIAVTVAAAGYQAGAVHFDGNVYLRIPSMTATDGTKLSWIVWLKAPGLPGSNNLWVIDANGDFQTFVEVESDSNNHIRFSAGSGSDFVLADTNIERSTTAWFCVIASTDVSAATTVMKIYLGDVDATGSIFGTSGPFTITASGKEFTLGSASGSSLYEGDMADFRLLPNVSLLDGGGDIPLATRRLFIDANGKPVDPAVATSALGAAGVVLCSGDATTFSTNQGTGGAISVVGGSLTNASTSPSD